MSRTPVVVLGTVADPTSAQHLVQSVPATEVAVCPSAERDSSCSARFFFSMSQTSRDSPSISFSAMMAPTTLHASGEKSVHA